MNGHTKRFHCPVPKLENEEAHLIAMTFSNVFFFFFSLGWSWRPYILWPLPVQSHDVSSQCTPWMVILNSFIVPYLNWRMKRTTWLLWPTVTFFDLGSSWRPHILWPLPVQSNDISSQWSPWMYILNSLIIPYLNWKIKWTTWLLLPIVKINFFGMILEALHYLPLHV